MSEKLALVCEGEHDRYVSVSLVERILKEDIEWYSGNEDYLREWCRINDSTVLYWKEIKTRFHFHGGKRRSLASLHAHGDGLAAEKALHITAFDCSPKAHVLFLRDCDGEPERLNALEQVRKQYPERSILIGFAVDRIEAWILAAFEPDDDAEKALLQNERKLIGFDPTCKPHELTAQAGDAKKNPKRVLDALFSKRGNNRQVYADLMNSFEWEHVEKDQRGEACGVLSFCKEIREKLVPCFSKVSVKCKEK